MLHIFIVQRQEFISDFERDFCDNNNDRTNERLTFLEFIDKHWRPILFPGPNGTVLEPTKWFLDEQLKHIRDLLI